MLSEGQLQAVAQLRALFANIDPGYLTAAVQAYPTEFSSDKVVSRVSAKLLDANHGHWPTVLYQNLSRAVSSSQSPTLRKKPVTLGTLLVGSLKTASSEGRRDKGKGRERTTSLASDSLLQVDETASRNVALIHLNAMFPSTDMAHLRSVLVDSDHSYIYQSLASLLNDPSFSPDNPDPCGRFGKRREAEVHPKRQHPGEMSCTDLIRDQDYIDSALRLLSAQYPHIWTSSIKAVMAEHNFDYFASVEALRRLQDERGGSVFTRAWSAFSTAFGKTARPAASDADAFSIQAYVTSLGSTSDISSALLYELHLHFSGLGDGQAKRNALTGSSSLGDAAVAERDTFECGCCFADVTWYAAASCAEGCLFCQECLTRAIKEVVFGQAPLQLLNDGTTGGSGTGVRCLGIEGCQAPFSEAELSRILPRDMYNGLSRRLGEEAMQACIIASKTQDGTRRGGKMRVIRCPFCPYAEIEGVPSLRGFFGDWTSPISAIANTVVGLLLSVLYAVWILASICFLDLLNLPRTSRRRSGDPSIHPHKSDAVLLWPLEPISGTKEITSRMTDILETCLTQKRTGMVFRCKRTAPGESQSGTTSPFASPTQLHSLLPPAPVSGVAGGRPSEYCGRPSCLLCGKLHYPGHTCSDSVEGLRLAMETAASNAVKRQCPECGLSFIRHDGCAKITCKCGYIMCYVCRKGIAAEKYSHFCQHPRVPPATSCQECNKCDLWKTGDDAAAARQAAELARREWLRLNPELDKDGTAGRVSANAGLIMPEGAMRVLHLLERVTAACLDLLV